jgi:ribose 5-phosphate isomerase RpiB
LKNDGSRLPWPDGIHRTLTICLGGRIVGTEAAWDLIQAFLAAEPSQSERHLRRLRKVALLEARSDCTGVR